MGSAKRSTRPKDQRRGPAKAKARGKATEPPPQTSSVLEGAADVRADADDHESSFSVGNSSDGDSSDIPSASTVRKEMQEATKARTLARRRKVSDKHTAWVHATSSSINAFIAKQRLTDRARRVSAYNELAELYSRKAKIEAEILSKAKRLEVALECALKELGVVVQGRREEIDQVFSAAKTEQQEQEMER